MVRLVRVDEIFYILFSYKYRKEKGKGACIIAIFKKFKINWIKITINETFWTNGITPKYFGPKS